MKNYYKILEVKPDANLKDIRASFLRLSKMYHPDLHQQDKDFEDFFKEIQEAYEVLKNFGRREEYDQQLRLFMRMQTSRGRAAFYIQNKLKKLKKRNGEEGSMDYQPYYQSRKPLKNIWRIAALLVFVSLAVILVFFAEKEFTEQSLNNIQLTYKNGQAEPEPMIVPEWEIPELPSSQSEELKKAEEPEEEIEEKTLSATPESKPENEAEESKKTEKQAKTEALMPVSLPEVRPEEKIEQHAVRNERSSDPDREAETSLSASAAETAPKTDKIYIETDKLPQFGGGSPAFVQYLKKNLQYPADAREKGITGRVLVTFVVEKNGEISNVSVVQGIGNGCDEEAVRVMQNAPAWVPGEEKGAKVRVQCTIPITFALQ